MVPDEDRTNVRELLRALGRLPFNQRAAITMRELEGRSYPEIAETLGVTVPAVEALLTRARRTLRLQAAAIRGLAVVGLPRSLRRLFENGEPTAGSAVGAGVVAKAAAVVVAGITAGGAGLAISEVGTPHAKAPPRFALVRDVALVSAPVVPRFAAHAAPVRAGHSAAQLAQPSDAAPGVPPAAATAAATAGSAPASALDSAAPTQSAATPSSHPVRHAVAGAAAAAVVLPAAGAAAAAVALPAAVAAALPPLPAVPAVPAVSALPAVPPVPAVPALPPAVPAVPAPPPVPRFSSPRRRRFRRYPTRRSSRNSPESSRKFSGAAASPSSKDVPSSHSPGAMPPAGPGGDLLFSR